MIYTSFQKNIVFFEYNNKFNLIFTLNISQQLLLFSNKNIVF